MTAEFIDLYRIIAEKLRGVKHPKPFDFETEIRQFEAQGLIFAPELFKRIGEHLEYRRRLRRRKDESWSYSSGSYSSERFYDESPWLEWKHGVENPMVYKVIERQIKGVQQRKKEFGDEKPTVVLDFGGMVGGSMLQLHHSTSETVRDSKIIFLVSNLAFYPTLQWLGKSYLDTPEIRNWMFHFKDGVWVPRIPYLQADAQELVNTYITMPNGSQYPLQGNVDIIHERNVLDKGRINDLDLPRIAKLLSKYGTFFMHSDYHPSFSGPARPIHDLGKANLFKMGLRELDKGGRKAHYRVYGREETPSLVLRP